jgi:GH24 family phage-related lysozyme (muramidase)
LDAHKSGNRWAIGFGHVEGGDNEPKVIMPGMRITRERANEILMQDLEDKARWLRQNIIVPVTSFMFQALISLTANAGQGNVRDGPVLPLLNAEKYVAAAVAFLHHNKAWLPIKDEQGNPVINPETGKPVLALQVSNGLTVRRCTEIGVFMTKKEK